jgi:hypothetical protein
VTGAWRKLHIEELHNLYSSPYIFILLKIMEDEIGWACSMHGRWEMYTKFCLEILGVEVRLILKWIIGKYGEGVWFGLIWLRTGCCEHSDEPLGSMKDSEFLH